MYLKLDNVPGQCFNEIGGNLMFYCLSGLTQDEFHVFSDFTNVVLVNEFLDWPLYNGRV